MSGESVSLAPGQVGNPTGSALDSGSAQSPGQIVSPLGGDANSATGGTGGPGGQPTEEVNIAPKRITLNGEVCLAGEGEPDCETEFSGTLIFLAWEGGEGDWKPENPPLVVNTDGTFAHPTSYYLIRGECQTSVRYEATYTEGTSTYYGELEKESCPTDGKEIPLRVLLEVPGLHHVFPDVLEGWVKR